MNISGDVFSSSSINTENLLFSVFYVVIFIIAVPGNTLALWTLFHQDSSSTSVVFLKHLSIADISYVLILPMRIVYHLSNGLWPLGHVLCELSGFLFYLNMYCSLYLMSFISLDRFFAVVFPVRSLSLRKAKYAKIAVVVLWMTIVVSVSPLLISAFSLTNHMPGVCRRLYLEKTSPMALVSTIVAFVLPLTTVVLSYFLVLLKLRTVPQQVQRPVRTKATRTIMLVLMNFLFAFAPYHVTRVLYIDLNARGNTTAAGLEGVRRGNQITSALTCVSGVFDPVMFYFLNQEYMKRLLTCSVKMGLTHDQRRRGSERVGERQGGGD